MQERPATGTLARIGRWFGIEPGEERVFAWGAGALFLIGWASVSVTNVSETFFLKRVGVTLLPLVFLANSILLVGTTFAVGRIVSRTEHRSLIGRTFLVLTGAILALWLLVLADLRSAFVLLVIAAKQLDAIALVVVWTALGGLLHARQAKRVYAPIMAGGTLGVIAGSFASAAIGRALGLAALLPVAAGALGLAGLLAIPLGRSRRARLRRVTGGTRPTLPPDAGPRLRLFWRESGLFRILVVSALLSGVLGPMLFFQFSYVADLATRGSNAEQRLLDLYAYFRGFLNLGVLAIQLAGTSRLFRRIGVPLASTLSPLVYLVGFFGVGVRLDLPAGIGAIAGANLQDHAIYEPAQRMLVTLFRKRERGAAMALIEGPVRRLGGALGNVVILAMLALGTPAWIGLAGLPIAALWLAATVALWRIYPTLLLEVASTRPLRADDGDGPQLPELVDPRTLRVLERALVDPDLDRCHGACELVLEAPRGRAIATLARAARHAPRATRTLLIEALHRLLARSAEACRPDPGAARHLEALLADPAPLDAVGRAHLLAAYGRLVPDLAPGSHAAAILAPLRSDPVPAVRLAATLLLATAPDEIDALLATALAADDAAARRVALEALRALLLATDGTAAGWTSRLTVVAARLHDPRERRWAAEILADVAAYHGTRLSVLDTLLRAHADDPDPRVRTAVLHVVGHARLASHAGWTVERLAADDVEEAAAAREALRRLGPAAMDALLAALHFGRRAIRAAALPLLREMPVDRRTLRTLVDAELDGVRRLARLRHGLAAGGAADLVLQRLGERLDESLHGLLVLLAILHHEDRFAVLARLLTRSQSTRAVLFEALETLLPPADRARLLPLLEESAASPAAAQALGRPLPSFDEALRDALVDRDPLTLGFLAATVEPATLARVGWPPELALPATAGDDGAVMLSRVEIVLHLRGLDIFAGLSTRQLSDLAGALREQRHPPGTTIVREGEFDDCMYLIVAGEVEVSAEGRRLAKLGPREFFGEMSVFDGETRAATVTAITRVRLLRLERHDLFQVMDEHPGIAIAICQTLSRRVRELIDRLQGDA
ncbi:MAG: cyclic nucleotide-binding domain-containing protein [Candidatus Binatia bacterium]